MARRRKIEPPRVKGYKLPDTWAKIEQDERVKSVKPLVERASGPGSSWEVELNPGYFFRDGTQKMSGVRIVDIRFELMYNVKKKKRR